MKKEHFWSPTKSTVSKKQKCPIKSGSQRSPECGLGIMYVSNKSSQDMLVVKSHIHDKNMGWSWVYTLQSILSPSRELCS